MIAGDSEPSAGTVIVPILSVAVVREKGVKPVLFHARAMAAKNII